VTGPEYPIYVTALRCGPFLWVAWWENYHRRAHPRFGFSEAQALRRCTEATVRS